FGRYCCNGLLDPAQGVEQAAAEFKCVVPVQMKESNHSKAGLRQPFDYTVLSNPKMSRKTLPTRIGQRFCPFARIAGRASIDEVLVIADPFRCQGLSDHMVDG